MLESMEVCFNLCIKLLFSLYLLIIGCVFLQDEEDDAVFDLVDEDEYQKVVEGRRNGVDFVVDDGNQIIYKTDKKHEPYSLN